MFLEKQFPVEQSMNPWYVTGLIEGSGSFTYSRSGDSVIPYFALKVGAQDRSLLQALQGFFEGSGRVYEVCRRKRQNSTATSAAVYFRVTRVAELARIVAHFDRYPLASSKAAAFARWRTLVAAKERFRRPDVAGISRVTRELSGIAGRRPRRSF
jgi:hypothetical protein